MKVLVLGGNGFVGKHVVELLKSKKYEAVPLSRRNGLDLTSFDSVEENFSRVKPDAIINCAAHVGSLHYVTAQAADVVRDNLQMSLNIYKGVAAFCPNAKIVNPISNCSYPGDADIQVESEWWNGPVHKSVWSYGNAKRMLAVISECYAIQHKIKSINLMFPNAYGPGDYTDPNKTHALNGMIIRMMDAKKNKTPSFEIWGTGKPQREWLYVKDLAKMLVMGLDFQEAQIVPLNIAQNKAYAIRETAEMIKKELGYSGELVFNTKYQDGALIKKMDDKLFRSKFPSFEFTPINKGIKETIAYYEKALGG
ncbi:MAG: NAD-dependent epimerase/dehydratase family protein [Candidatus Bilamarchaeaceae archaeon]